jgi:hypothetical protein
LAELESSLSKSEKLTYYVSIRESISKFDDLLFRIAVEGGTLSIGLLSLSGIFFQEKFLFAAGIVSIGSIVTTLCFSFMAWFYSQLLGKAAETAKKIEKQLFCHNESITCLIDDEVKFGGRKLAGGGTWLVVMGEFILLLVLAIALLIFYSFPIKLF